VTWTAGLSYDDFEQDPIDVDEVNPKLGLQWDITNRLRLRAAYMQTVKRALVVDQTLEPTQVAGFNQFFDDFDATEAERYGVGLDVKFSRDLYGGVEVSQRNLDIPAVINETDVVIEEQRENLYGAYLY
jgi:hypothetical protein